VIAALLQRCPRCLKGHVYQGDNVKLGPDILTRTMLNPFEH